MRLKTLIFIGLLTVIGVLLPFLAFAATPEEAASSLYNTYGSAFSSTSGFNDRIVQPLTSANKPMTTLNGSKSFNAQLTCPSTAKFLEVAITPSVTGDLQATIRQDTNFDGIADYTYFPPFQISGVCSNGLIACTPGTWANCSYYLWTVNAGNFQVSLNSTSMTALGGCYCVNKSCGAGFSDYYTVLADIGGGAVGAVQAVDARFAITDVKTAADSVSYYGQDTGSCAGTGSTTGLQAFFNTQNDSGLISASDSAMQSQMSNTSSAYYNLKQSFNNSSTGAYVASCDIRRNITITTQTYPTVGSSLSSGTICTDHFLYARVLENGFDYHLQILDTGPANQPHNGCDAGGSGLDGWHTLEVITLPRQASSVYFCVTASGVNCTPGPSNCVSMPNMQTLLLTCADMGAQTVTYDYTYDIQYQEDLISESITDGCTSLAADPSCKLKKETIDGVITIANFSPTGNRAPNTCQTFTGVDIHDICRDWWVDTKEYMCYGTKTSFDFSNAMARGEAIKGSMVQSGSNLFYNDYRQTPTGGFTTVPGAMTLYDAGTFDACIKACKVRVPKTNTQAGLSGTVMNYQVSNATYDIFYKMCSSGVCPLDTGAGEELLTDCACPDNFTEAAAIMSALQEASKDIICSSTGGW